MGKDDHLNDSIDDDEDDSYDDGNADEDDFSESTGKPRDKFR